MVFTTGAERVLRTVDYSDIEVIPGCGHCPQVEVPDVLAGLVTARGSAPSPVIVGFAAETGDATHTVLDHARAKLERKGCDLIVANEVGPGKTFGQDTTTVHILRRGSDAVTDAGPASKEAVAATVWDVVQDVLPPR